MARKTREESLAIKHRILDAAELVLLEKGVAQTAMADLAEAAGMSRGAVYGHYRNKMEVCLAMCDRAFARTSEGFDAGDGLPPLATLRRAASHYLQECGEPGPMQRVLVILYTKCEQSEENGALQRRRMLLELHRCCGSRRRCCAARSRPVNSPPISTCIWPPSISCRCSKACSRR